MTKIPSSVADGSCVFGSIHRSPHHRLQTVARVSHVNRLLFQVADITHLSVAMCLILNCEISAVYFGHGKLTAACKLHTFVGNHQFLYCVQ